MSEGINMRAVVQKALASVPPEHAPLLRPYLRDRLNGLYPDGIIHDPHLPERIEALLNGLLNPEKSVIIETVQACLTCCHGGHLPAPCPSSICCCGHPERMELRH